MVVMSKANRMRAQLRELRHERNIVLPDTPILPLLSEIAPPIIMSGIACSALTLDADHIRTAPFAFGDLSDLCALPLRLDHDDKQGVVGEIVDLTYDRDGSLLIEARVVDPRAVRMPAFSVAAIVDEYEIDARELTATVKRARLCEISLVRQPLDGFALVQSRREPLAVSEFYTLMAARVRNLAAMTEIVRSRINASPA
jgi:hypothetical protein